MTQAIPTLHVKSWNTIKKAFFTEKNSSLFKALDATYKRASKGKDYVYVGEFEFGEILIERGNINLDKFSIKNTEFFSINSATFKKDLGYSTDPLGMVVDGYLEVFVENKSSTTQTYRVPIDMIKTGDLFGTFGTIDYYLGLPHFYDQRDWFVASGNISSLWVAAPLHNSTENNELNDSLQDSFHNNLTIDINKWVKFINYYKSKDWKVSVLYFPKNIVEDLLDKNFKSIFEIGWKQSYHLRNTLLSNNLVENKMDDIRLTDIWHGKLFLGNLYKHILAAINGTANCFIPLIDDEHFINNAIANFKEKSAADIHFCCFQYEQIPEDGFGLIFLPLMPVLSKYSVESLNYLMNDLFKISHKLPAPYQIHTYVEAYCNTRLSKKNKVKQKLSSTKKLVKPHEDLKKNYLKSVFNKRPIQINLTAREVSNIILIKRKIKK